MCAATATRVLGVSERRNRTSGNRDQAKPCGDGLARFRAWLRSCLCQLRGSLRGIGRSLRTHQRELEIFFGIVTVFLGLFFAGWWPSTMLQREKRIHRLPRISILGAAVLGFTFALGWTPCIGPTLAVILGLTTSSSGATALRGSLLAFVYCLGLGLPFVAAAAATEWMAGTSMWLRRHQKVIGRIGGVFLILIGIAEVTGAWSSFVLWLQIHVPSSTTFL